jgi:ATP-dependent phosphoenolpyruvate carboxykinase
MVESFSLHPHGITVKEVFRNLAPSSLYEEAIRHEPGTSISDTGCLIAYSGDKTGDLQKTSVSCGTLIQKTTSGGDR